ncbi:hypothetical protein B566_EDAN018208 [Ephemera danica]|nr:hypothetical protein B566_EDAN018208 [Ephemera danica]
MPRVKRGVTAHARHKKILALAKGFRGRRKNVYRIAKQAVMKAGQYAYRDRRTKKRAGSVTEALKGLARCTPEEKKARGARINEAKQAIEAALQARRDSLANAELQAQLKAQALDVTLPGRQRGGGSLHPVSRTIERIEAIFGSMGFDVAQGPEIETDWMSFTALNNPENHPARSMQDTFYAVESLAGIMGGQATAVSDETRNIYVEAAFWWPEAVAGRSRRFNFSTDAGHRFERGVDPALTVEHIEHITALIQQICGGQAGPMDDQTLVLPERKPVTLRVARAAKVLGMPLTQAQCAQTFMRLGLAFTQDEGSLTVTPPSWRFDLAIEEDLIEEVIRVIGLHHLPTTPPHAPVSSRPQLEGQRGAHRVRHQLAALGYQETINFSFVEERAERELAGNADPIRVLNPIAAHLAAMRSSLMGSLLEVLKTNLARKASRVQVFEIGRVFRRDAAVTDTLTTVAGVAQPMRVAGLAYGPAVPIQWGARERGVDFFDVKGDVETLLQPTHAVFVAAEHPAMHPGRCAQVQVDGQGIGFVGELHPRWRQAHGLQHAPILFELALDAVQCRQLPVFHALPRQQSALRDVALVVGDQAADEQADDDFRVAQIEGDAHAPAFERVRVISEQHQRGQTGRTDGVALGHCLGGVADRVQWVGDIAHAGRQFRHFGNTTGVVGDGAVGVQCHHDAGHAEHGGGGNGNAVQTSQAISGQDGRADEKHRPGG